MNLIAADSWENVSYGKVLKAKTRQKPPFKGKQSFVWLWCSDYLKHNKPRIQLGSFNHPQASLTRLILSHSISALLLSNPRHWLSCPPGTQWLEWAVVRERLQTRNVMCRDGDRYTAMDCFIVDQKIASNTTMKRTSRIYFGSMDTQCCNFIPPGTHRTVDGLGRLNLSVAKSSLQEVELR